MLFISISFDTNSIFDCSLKPDIDDIDDDSLPICIQYCYSFVILILPVDDIVHWYSWWWYSFVDIDSFIVVGIHCWLIDIHSIFIDPVDDILVLTSCYSFWCCSVLTSVILRFYSSDTWYSVIIPVLMMMTGDVSFIYLRWPVFYVVLRSVIVRSRSTFCSTVVHCPSLFIRSCSLLFVGVRSLHMNIRSFDCYIIFHHLFIVIFGIVISIHSILRCWPRHSLIIHIFYIVRYCCSLFWFCSGIDDDVHSVHFWYLFILFDLEVDTLPDASHSRPLPFYCSIRVLRWLFIDTFDVILMMLTVFLMFDEFIGFGFLLTFPHTLFIHTHTHHSHIHTHTLHTLLLHDLHVLTLTHTFSPFFVLVWIQFWSDSRSFGHGSGFVRSDAFPCTSYLMLFIHLFWWWCCCCSDDRSFPWYLMMFITLFIWFSFILLLLCYCFVQVIRLHLRLVVLVCSILLSFVLLRSWFIVHSAIYRWFVWLFLFPTFVRDLLSFGGILIVVPIRCTMFIHVLFDLQAFCSVRYSLLFIRCCSFILVFVVQLFCLYSSFMMMLFWWIRLFIVAIDPFMIVLMILMRYDLLLLFILDVRWSFFWSFDRCSIRSDHVVICSGSTYRSVDAFVWSLHYQSLDTVRCILRVVFVFDVFVRSLFVDRCSVLFILRWLFVDILLRCSVCLFDILFSVDDDLLLMIRRVTRIVRWWCSLLLFVCCWWYVILLLFIDIVDGIWHWYRYVDDCYSVVVHCIRWWCYSTWYIGCIYS